MKKLFLFFLFFSMFSFAQVGPPPASMPKGKQIELIDEFVKISNFEETLKKFGQNYMFSKMYKYEHGKYVQIVTKEESDKIINNFNFTAFKKNSIYNAYSFVSEENLKALIDLYSKLNGKIDKSGNLFLINSVIIQNYTGYINTEIEKLLKEK